MSDTTADRIRREQRDRIRKMNEEADKGTSSFDRADEQARRQREREKRDAQMEAELRREREASSNSTESPGSDFRDGRTPQEIADDAQTGRKKKRR